MTRHPVRKMFGLTVLYIFIIFGIFFIQFRKESIITKIFGPFQLIISETHDQNNQIGLANSFQLSVNGFSYSTNEADPVTLRKGGKDISLTFTGYSGEDSTLALCFDNDVVLTWDSPDPEDIPYTIKAELPEGSESVTIPYRMISSFTTEDISSDEECRIILSQKETEYELKVADISESGLTLTTAMPRLSYGYKEEIHIFTFEDVAELELARQSVFTDTKQQLRSAVATAFPQAGFTASSEKAVMAWLAEQASRGNLTQSLNQIPDSLKTASGHTYFSAPYFDTLASVAPGLRKALADVESQVTNAVILNNPSVYEIDMLEMYLLTHGKAACHPVLDMAQDINISTLPLSQAGAILQLYVNLSSQKPEYASHLEPVLDSCIALFEKHAQLDGDKVILVEDEEPLDRITTAKAGLALAQTGTLRSDKTVQQAGYIILNSALSELYTLTVEELAELYPLFTPENKYYPHVALLDDSSTEPVWAWTVAQNMTFKSTAKGITEFTATFPQNGIHYMIVNGIKPFTTIQIYGMQFRTDPRFETYNSSGYVYQADSNTLLLKYRQRSETEVVTLDSSVPQPAATQAAAPAAPAATPAAETPAAAASPAASTATTPAAPASSAAPAATTPATSPAPATTTEQPIIKPGRSGASL